MAEPLKEKNMNTLLNTIEVIPTISVTSSKKRRYSFAKTERKKKLNKDTNQGFYILSFYY